MTLLAAAQVSGTAVRGVRTGAISGASRHICPAIFAGLANRLPAGLNSATRVVPAKSSHTVNAARHIHYGTHAGCRLNQNTMNTSSLLLGAGQNHNTSAFAQSIPLYDQRPLSSLRSHIHHQTRALHTSSLRLATHYEKLGIGKTATPIEIKKAYFRKAKECHPDIHGTSKTKEFQELSHAYSVLSDPQQRAAYDRQGARDFNYDAPQPGPGQSQHQAPPNMKEASEMFRQVWADFGFKEYCDTLSNEFSNAYDSAVKTQSYTPLWDFAKHRKGLFLGVGSLALPALVVFRFPHVAALVVRGFMVVGSAFIKAIARDPQLGKLVQNWLWNRFKELSRQAAQSAKKRQAAGGAATGGARSGPTAGSGARSSSSTGSAGAKPNANGKPSTTNGSNGGKSSTGSGSNSGNNGNRSYGTSSQNSGDKSVPKGGAKTTGKIKEARKGGS